MKFPYLILLLSGYISCTGQSSGISADEFEKATKQQNVQVLDVRTPGEFKTGHIANALSADWNNKAQFYDRVAYLDKEKEVLVYCLVGGRSAAAADWMRKNGFKKITELNGGINAWKAVNKPLEAETPQKQMTSEEYWASISKDQTVLVDFGAQWCPPCVKMQPVTDELQKDKSLHFQFVKIDAGIHTDVMKSLNLEPIPAFIIYKNGKEVWRKEGIVTKEEFETQLK